MEVPAQRIPAGLPAQIGLYRSLLADRRVLIVLDNARDAEQVRPLLPGSPGCRVVITSRNQLSGLVAADGAHPLTLDLLTTAEAGALLARRLGAERVAAEPDAVDEIIMRCARLPLALAIVAARAVLRAGLPLAALAGELRDTHGGLGAFHGDDPATNVRAVFSWSYHTLSTDAARLFRLLGLHPGPDIAVAAAASLAGVPLARARPLLAELTRAHLAAVHTAGRYTCHDLLRAYATEQAHTHDTDDERRTATHRLLDHYLHTTHTADRLVEPLGRQLTLAPYQPGVTAVDLADYEQAMAWLTSEHRVLLAAISQANGTFDGHTWQLAHCLRYFFVRRAMWQDMTTAQRHALAAAERLGDRLAQALIHDGMVQAHGMLGRQDDAYLHLRRALDLFEELGDHAGEGHMHLALAWMAGLRGRHAEALRHAQRSLDLYRAAKHRAWQARALSGVGWYHAELGDYPTAVARLQDALVLHQEVGDISGESDTWHSLGLAHHRLEQYERAAACYRRALDLTRQTLDRHDEATYLNDLGDTRLALGDHHAAVAAWQRALRIFEEIGNFDADDVRAKLADQTRAQANVVRMDST
jgi:tetratricopeptide (TPR) repeat protein